jgi:hypothetical protein
MKENPAYSRLLKKARRLHERQAKMLIKELVLRYF